MALDNLYSFSLSLFSISFERLTTCLHASALFASWWVSMLHKLWQLDHTAILRQEIKPVNQNVILILDNSLRSQWNLGKITNLNTGRDRKNRIAQVKTVKGAVTVTLKKNLEASPVSTWLANLSVGTACTKGLIHLVAYGSVKLWHKMINKGLI